MVEVVQRNTGGRVGVLRVIVLNRHEHDIYEPRTIVVTTRRTTVPYFEHTLRLRFTYAARVVACASEDPASLAAHAEDVLWVGAVVTRLKVCFHNSGAATEGARRHGSLFSVSHTLNYSKSAKHHNHTPNAKKLVVYR